MTVFRASGSVVYGGPPTWKQPTIVFVVALVVRLAHLWQMRESPFFSVLMGDSRSYDEWARQIAAGDFSRPPSYVPSGPKML